MTHLHRKQNETKTVRQASRRQGRAECPSQLCQYCLRSADTPEENILPVPEPTAEDNRVDQTFREQRTTVGRRTAHREESTEELGIRWNMCCVIPRRHVPMFLIFTGTTVQHTRTCAVQMIETRKPNKEAPTMSRIGRSLKLVEPKLLVLSCE